MTNRVIKSSNIWKRWKYMGNSDYLRIVVFVPGKNQSEQLLLNLC